MVRLVMVAAGVALTAVLFAGCGGGGDERAKVEANLQRFLATPEHAPSFPAGGPPRVKDNSCFKLEGSHAVLPLIAAKDVRPGMMVVLWRGMKVVAWPGSRSSAPVISSSYWNCLVKIGANVVIPVIVAVADESNDVLMADPRLPNTESEPPRIYPNTCKPKTRTRGGTCTKVEWVLVSPAG
jgi:hypothetical protein